MTPTTHASSWARFQEYATLVRVITIDPSVQAFKFPSKLLQGTFWSQVSSAFGEQPILPRLEVATLFSPMPFGLFDFDMGALRFLNPSLRELSVIFPGVGLKEQSNFRSIVSSCLSASYNLEALSVEIPIPVVDIDPMPQLYPRLHRLKIDDDGIHPDHIALLASLPNLEYLSIVLTPRMPPNQPIAFAKLRSLEVFSYDSTGIGLLVTHVEAPRLRSFHVSETHGDFDDMYPQKFLQRLRTIARKFPLLSAFRWTTRDLSTDGYENAMGAVITLAELLEPLLSLCAMRSFSASFARPLIPYSPADLRKVAEAWPEIETVYLSVSGGRDVHYADLKSLASFARHCPHLRSLRIPSVKLDANASVPAIPSTPPHLLQELTIANVILPGGFEDAFRQGKRLSSLMKQIFPSAKISFPIRAPLRSRAGAATGVSDEKEETGSAECSGSEDAGDSDSDELEE